MASFATGGVIDPKILAKWLGRKAPLRPNAELRAQLEHPAIAVPKKEGKLGLAPPPPIYPRLGSFEVMYVLLQGETIVTSGLRAYIEACLARWDVDVDFIVAGDDEGVPHKPAPDPYLTACDHFDVAPADCVAVEDSPSGLRSALAAGVPVVAIANPANAGLPLLDEARAVQGDLTDRAPFGM